MISPAREPSFSLRRPGSARPWIWFRLAATGLSLAAIVASCDRSNSPLTPALATTAEHSAHTVRAGGSDSWHGYTPPEVELDREAEPAELCASWDDPHLFERYSGNEPTFFSFDFSLWDPDRGADGDWIELGSVQGDEEGRNACLSLLGLEDGVHTFRVDAMSRHREGVRPPVISTHHTDPWEGDIELGAAESGEGGESDPEACSPTTIDFDCAGALSGWALTGDWGLYTQAPPSSWFAAAPFPATALGTDGNRSAPYPGSEFESSSATSPPGMMDETLSFLSWHVDDGGAFMGFDNKTIRFIPEDGGDPVTLVDCSDGALNDYPFCDWVDFARGGDDWDTVTIDTSALSGREGRIELGYDTRDNCCTNEQGWYVRNLDFTLTPL